MITKAKIGQLWTDSVAYVALFTGAGLSIAGNVANVVRTRGVQVDTLDVVLAVAFPALVVLMVEVFVSSRWRGLSWPMQILRWLGTLSIGAVAMRVSWVHLNELMVSRGQAQDVATLGPLAIDFLAIMATALILAGRGQTTVQVDTPPVQAPRPPAQEPVMDMASADIWNRLDSLAGDQEPTLPVPVSPSPSNTVKPESVPADAADMIMAWAMADQGDRPRAGDVDKLVAADLDVTPRTVRRWRTAVLGS